MKSKITASFRKQYAQLPPDIRQRVRRAYRAWKHNPNLPGLYFKRVNDNAPIYSVRVGLDYRALGMLKGDTITWYWIGKHEEYDRLLR
jgi:mRNA-degrading endonuclease RelE of RelBE toxin-antitoxin system